MNIFSNRLCRTGFTLFEVLIYLALFSIIFSGAITSAFTIFQISGRNQTEVLMQQEGYFLIAKINFILANSKLIVSPTLDSLSHELKVNTDENSVEVPVSLGLDGAVFGNMYIVKEGELPQVLNNTNVEVGNLVFKRSENFGGSEYSQIISSFSIQTRTPSGQIILKDFSTIQYVK